MTRGRIASCRNRFASATRARLAGAAIDIAAATGGWDALAVAGFEARATESVASLSVGNALVAAAPRTRVAGQNALCAIAIGLAVGRGGTGHARRPTRSPVSGRHAGSVAGVLPRRAGAVTGSILIDAGAAADLLVRGTFDPAFGPIAGGLPASDGWARIARDAAIHDAHAVLANACATVKSHLTPWCRGTSRVARRRSRSVRRGGGRVCAARRGTRIRRRSRDVGVGTIRTKVEAGGKRQERECHQQEPAPDLHEAIIIGCQATKLRSIRGVYSACVTWRASSATQGLVDTRMEALPTFAKSPGVRNLSRSSGVRNFQLENPIRARWTRTEPSVPGHLSRGTMSCHGHSA